MTTATQPLQRISLERYRGDRRNRVLAGRQRGTKVREETRLDVLDTQEGFVLIEVPEDLFAVTSSFFLGMFGPSIEKLGAEGFRAHYQFTGMPVTEVIEDAIASVQLTGPL